MSLSEYCLSLVNGGRPWTPTAQQLMERKSPRPAPLVSDLIHQGVILLVAKPKVGKTFLCLQVALGVASGVPVLGREVAAQEVLYLALEDRDPRMLGRLEMMLQGALFLRDST